MTQQQEYEERIKAIVKEAMADYVSWTPKQFGEIRDAAVREMTEAATRKMFGGSA
jgi:hypothetical protein